MPKTLPFLKRSYMKIGKAGTEIIGIASLELIQLHNAVTPT